MTAAASAAVSPERLRRSADVVRVLRAGSRVSGNLTVVHTLPASEDAGRIAVVASRRVGGAVQRNRAKRVIRAALRELTLPTGRDLVIVARPTAATCRSGDVQRELGTLLGRLSPVGSAA